jgi:hypothetical protein
MESNKAEKVEIEKIEYNSLLKLNNAFHESLEDFNTQLDSSLNYLDYIALPVIMSSIEEKAYNPFAEIIEKYVELIVVRKMETYGYTFLPIGYCADICFDGRDSFIHVDIKTANLNNPSDFKDTIPIGLNQTSYPAKLPLGLRAGPFYLNEGKEPFKFYPVLPVEYQIDGKKKITVTNALLFIYPDYKDIMDEFRNDYEQICSLIDGKLQDTLMRLLEGSLLRITRKDVDEFLEKKNKNTNIKNRRVLYENIVRGYYIHKLSEKIDSNLNLNASEKQKMNRFLSKVKEAAQKLREKNIKPVAIISISIPNGKLSPHYDDEIVSGKSYGKSIRYHYEEGKFKLLDSSNGTKSRVVFLDYDEKYLETLRKYFTKIYVFETGQKEIT